VALLTEQGMVFSVTAAGRAQLVLFRQDRHELEAA
jgi:hypothetical protein